MLQDDEYDGQDDNAQGTHEVACAIDGKAIRAHILGKGKGCGTFCKLGRLDAYRPKCNP